MSKGICVLRKKKKKHTLRKISQPPPRQGAPIKINVISQTDKPMGLNY